MLCVVSPPEHHWRQNSVCPGLSFLPPRLAAVLVSSVVAPPPSAPADPVPHLQNLPSAASFPPQSLFRLFIRSLEPCPGPAFVVPPAERPWPPVSSPAASFPSVPSTPSE